MFPDVIDLAEYHAVFNQYDEQREDIWLRNSEFHAGCLRPAIISLQHLFEQEYKKSLIYKDMQWFHLDMTSEYFL